MTLNEKIVFIYPELIGKCSPFPNSPYIIQDDSNGLGPYIKKWNYFKPEPTQEQLDALDD